MPCFRWYRDQLLCSGPYELQIVKLVHIAGPLGARVVGNDGERYDIRRFIFGREEVVQPDSYRLVPVVSS